MQQLRKLIQYEDKLGNSIKYSGSVVKEKINIKFRGQNNRLEIDARAKIQHLSVDFWGDNGKVVIGPTIGRRTGLRFSIRVGHGSTVTIGPDVGCTARAFVAASEGADVTIGEDCMIAAGIEIRADDAHALYDVESGRRANPAQSVVIGDHVWLAKFVTVLGGVTIGSGSTIGLQSVVTRDVPNNCVAVGSPARVVRRNAVWERPMLAKRLPDKLKARVAERTERYWNRTVDDESGILTKGTDADSPHRASRTGSSLDEAEGGEASSHHTKTERKSKLRDFLRGT